MKFAGIFIAIIVVVMLAFNDAKPARRLHKDKKSVWKLEQSDKKIEAKLDKDEGAELAFNLVGGVRPVLDRLIPTSQPKHALKVTLSGGKLQRTLKQHQFTLPRKPGAKDHYLHRPSTAVPTQQVSDDVEIDKIVDGESENANLNNNEAVNEDNAKENGSSGDTENNVESQDDSLSKSKENIAVSEDKSPNELTSDDLSDDEASDDEDLNSNDESSDESSIKTSVDEVSDEFENNNHDKSHVNDDNGENDESKTNDIPHDSNTSNDDSSDDSSDESSDDSSDESSETASNDKEIDDVDNHKNVKDSAEKHVSSDGATIADKIKVDEISDKSGDDSKIEEKKKPKKSGKNVNKHNKNVDTASVPHDASNGSHDESDANDGVTVSATATATAETVSAAAVVAEKRRFKLKRVLGSRSLHPKNQYGH